MNEKTIIAVLAGNKAGMSAKEVGKATGEATPIVMEQLLTMAVAGTLNQRTVGRDQVFSLAKHVAVPATAIAAEVVDTAVAVVADAVAVPPATPAAVTSGRIGGKLTLQICDEPITATFQSVEQLHRFTADLVKLEGGAA